MKSYRTFVFDTFVFNECTGELQLHYSLDDEVTFIEKLQLPTEEMNVKDMDIGVLERSLLALHLIGGVSYYKTHCPKTIEVRSGELTVKQAQWWNTLYQNGLGEFFYRNQIDGRDLVRFPSSHRPKMHSKTRPSHSRSTSPRGQAHLRSPSYGHEGSPRGGQATFKDQNALRRILIPIGGGKDSIVTIELLKAAGYDCTLLRMGPHPIVDQIARIAGLPMLTVERTLSPTLFKLNAEGALNGHVPITSYLSFLAVLTAHLYDFDAVVMSCEGSASEGNVRYLDSEINHQWSKSMECERMMQEYIETFFTAPTVETPESPLWGRCHLGYFSLLRPFSELKITQLFCRYPQYFHSFTSCNANWRIAGSTARPKGGPLWCCTCPKCAFVFACLAAFLPRATVQGIVGGNPFDDPSLIPLYKHLLGLEGSKPFECVGTPQETQAAFLLMHRSGDYGGTSAMTLFEREMLPSIRSPETLLAEVLGWSDDHILPARIANTLQPMTAIPSAASAAAMR